MNLLTLIGHADITNIFTYDKHNSLGKDDVTALSEYWIVASLIYNLQDDEEK